MQIWRRSERFDPALGTASAWLAVIARRKAIDHVRSRARVERQTIEADADVIERIPAAANGAEQMSDLRALSGCLERLDPRHGRAILLAYFNGWSREELAAHFGTPENTVKSWLRRALSSLRTCMDGN